MARLKKIWRELFKKYYKACRLLFKENIPLGRPLKFSRPNSEVAVLVCNQPCTQGTSQWEKQRLFNIESTSEKLEVGRIENANWIDVTLLTLKQR